MNKNEKDYSEEDVFDEHRIAYTLEKDYNDVLNSQTIADFHDGLAFKSPKTAAKDLAAFDLLLSRMKAYKNGWAACNANKTAELWNKSLALDNQRKEIYESLKPEVESLNKLTNDMIIALKDKFTKEQLDSLRNLEKSFKQKMNQL